MKGITSWLKGFGTASLVSITIIEGVFLYATTKVYDKEKKLKEYYRDELEKCKNQDSEKTE